MGRIRLVALLAAALAAGGVLSHLYWRPAGPQVPSYRRLTFRRGNIGTARFAPDGRSVVYSASWEGEPLEIYTTRPEGPESTPIGVKNADLFGVSPSGELAISLRGRFLGGPSGTGTLATVPIGGGAPRSIAEFVDRADWTPDGKQLAIQRFLDGRNRIELPLGKVITASERGFSAPRVSPRGDRIAFLERAPGGAALRTVDLGGKVTTLVPEGIRGQALAWSPSGDEVWFDNRGERGQFFLSAASLAGRVRLIASTPVGLIIHDVSRDGRILAERYGSQPGILGLAPGQTRERDLSWFDGSHPVSLSDDGLALLINESGDAAGQTGAYYLRKTDGSPAVKLGQGEALDLSADGKWVLARHPDSKKNLVLQPTGTGTPITIDESLFENVAGATLFPDGKRLLLVAAEPGKKRRLYVQELPSGKPRPITDRAFGFGNRPLTPDGRWIAAYGDWSEDMLLLPVDGGNPRAVPNSKDLDLIRWTPDGKAYFAVLLGSIPARVFRVDVATGRREDWRELAPPERAGIIEIGPGFLTPDGKSYVYGYSRAATSDLYLIDGLR